MIPASTLRLLVKQHQEEQLILHGAADFLGDVFTEEETQAFLKQEAEKFVRDLHAGSATLADFLLEEVHWKQINNDVQVLQDKYVMQLHVPHQSLKGISSAVLLGGLTIKEEQRFISVDSNVLRLVFGDVALDARKSFLKNLGIATSVQRLSDVLSKEGYTLNSTTDSTGATTISIIF